MSFEKKKFMPANSLKNPNLTMHWQREMENVACRVLVRVKVSVKVRVLVNFIVSVLEAAIMRDIFSTTHQVSITF